MPIYRIINTSFSNGAWAKILVWKISESLDDLAINTFLTAKSKRRLASMKSETHQKGFLCIRKLLLECTFFDKDLIYDETGKPFLKNEMHVSITHSHDFAAIIISDHNVGIDIELQRDKIKAIATKFCNTEFTYLEKDTSQYVTMLTTIWGAKESIFKIENKKGISFKDHIEVKKFRESDKYLTALLGSEEQKSMFEMQVVAIENYVLVFGSKL